MKKNKKVLIRLDEDQLNMLEKLAEINGTSKSQYIRGNIIKSYFDTFKDINKNVYTK